MLEFSSSLKVDQIKVRGRILLRIKGDDNDIGKICEKKKQERTYYTKRLNEE